MSNETSIKDRVAIVVGAGGELGRATAVKLASQGMTVVAVDRNELGLASLPEDIVRETADATNPENVAPLIERIVKDVGVPDVLVNTLGAFQTADAMTTTPELFHVMIDVNLAPALWLSQAVAPHMQTKGSGAIVFIASRPGLEPAAGMAGYAVAKAALVHLTRVLDLELRPSGIRVNAVAPQLIDTAKNRSFIPKDVLSHAVSPQAIAEVVAFLVSDAAAAVSGAILPAYGA